MKQFLITVAGVVTGFFLILIIPIFLLILIGIAAGSAMSPSKVRETGPVVLRVDLREPMLDQQKSSFFEKQPSLLDLVKRLKDAARDKNVKGVFIRANSFGIQPAQAEQIRTAIDDFEKSGKFVIAHSQGFDGTSVTSYLSVAGVSELWMQGASNFAASGLATETPFYGGMFEKFKAKPEFEQFYEYKSAVNTYTKKTYTEAQKESLHSWLNSIFTTAVTEIAKDRGKDKQTMLGLIENGPYLAEDAQKAGLVDKIGHVVDAREEALKKAGKNARLVELEDYHPDLPKLGKSAKGAPLVALIEGQGVIQGGEGSGNPFSNETGIYSDQMSKAILDAAKDKKVKALLIRVDSPGGSAIASDQIWYAIEKAKKEGKKVIISMGQLAASGGYYISAGADAIVAYPTTLTGSIGVYGGKIVLKDTFGMVGYNVEQMKVGGEYTGAYSAVKSFTPEQRAKFRAGMAATYEDFTSIVAKGRKIPLEKVLEIAKGRVWTGEQAKKIGLVDELGGFDTAIAKTRELIGLKKDDKIRLKEFPSPKTEIEQLYDFFGITAQTAETAVQVHNLMQSEDVQAMIKARELAARGVHSELEAQIPQVK